ncbi:MAG: gamma-glutamyltransferase, partial [Alphaproteobacteria bacterium]|nr:gamma-glutamyltransferase [Alphaproteobacteria bacterium]
MPGFTTRPEIRGTFGVVATTHWLASSVGMSVLEKGGNAFDAAAAAGFTLQVVEPHLNGPLGEAPILVYSAKNRRCDMICGQGVAPAAATIERYKGLGLDLIPGTGLLAATVPGAFGAWARLLRDYGTMPLGEIMAPALGYAENGYPVVGRIRDTIMTVADLFRREWPTSAAVYLPNGSPPVPGKLFRNPALAATYKRVLAEAGSGNREHVIERARDAWYRGFVAEAIERFCRTQEVLDASGRRHGGLLTADDMARWQVPVEKPLTYDYRGYTVVKGGPWSQGPVLLQQLALLQGFDLDGLDPTGPDFVHIVTECAKLAYADREAWYGDPDFVDVPMATLLSPAYNDARRKLIGERASLELRPGRPDRREPYVLVGGLETAAGPGIGEPTVGPIAGMYDGIGEPTTSPLGAVAGDTVHIDIIDRWGNMVSATPSGGWLQSSPVIPELGFC